MVRYRHKLMRLRSVSIPPLDGHLV
jgi:hypothetical protein